MFPQTYNNREDLKPLIKNSSLLKLDERYFKFQKIIYMDKNLRDFWIILIHSLRKTLLFHGRTILLHESEHYFMFFQSKMLSILCRPDFRGDSSYLNSAETVAVSSLGTREPLVSLLFPQADS